MIGACYIRVSTDEQTEYSPDAQLKALKIYAENNNITIDPNHIYTDEGVSGRTAEKRPEFMRMINNAKKKLFDVILVHKFDRFARSRYDSIVYKTMLLKEFDIKVISITESIEDDKIALLVEPMLEAMAEYYSVNLAEEVKKGMTEKALNGEYNGKPPLGYEMINKELKIVPEEAKIINLIYSKYKETLSRYKTAKYINELGYKTRNANNFDGRGIYRIVNNPVYKGFIRWNKKGQLNMNFWSKDAIITKGKHEPIIKPEEWDELQKIIIRKKETTPKYIKSNTPKHWLSGLMRCSTCNSVLVIGGTNYFRCNKYQKGACENSSAILIKKAELLILNQIKKDFAEKTNINIIEKPKQKNELEILEESIKKIDMKLERVKLAYENGIDTLEEYKEKKTKIEIEKQEVVKNIEKIKNESKTVNIIKEIRTNAKTAYEILTDPLIKVSDKYETSHVLINKIIHNKEKAELIIFYN